MQNLIGRKFGRLTIISKTDKKIGGNYIYLCKCDCGNICEIASYHLKDTMSCGCLKKETAQRDVIDGTRLRNLTMKKPERKNKDSGVKGVIWDTENKKWRAQIGIKGKRINLGRFNNLNDAIEARKKAEEVYFKPILDKHKGANNMQPKHTHGGYRPGAGAKKQAPPGAKRRTFLITDAEHIKVKEYIQQLRRQ